MALTVPIYRSQESLSPQGNSPTIAPNTGQQSAAALSGMGESLSRFGVAMARLDQYRRQQDNYIQATKTTGALYGTLSDLSTKYASDPDISTAPQRFSADAQAAFNAATASIQDPMLKAQIEADYQRLKMTQDVSLKKALQKRRVDQGAAALDVTTDGLAKQAATTTSDAEFHVIQQTAANVIDGAAASGVITAQDAVKRKEQFVTRRDALRVEQMATGDPEGTLKRLADPTFMADMDPDKRQALLGHVAALANANATRALAAEARQDRLEDRAQRQVQAATAKDGDDLAAQGKLTPDWIQANKDRLDPGDYRYFWKQATNPQPGSTNPEVYTGLLDRATKLTEQSDLDGVRDDARQALLSRQIKVDDYNKIVGMVEHRSAQGDLPNWHQLGTDYISKALAPSPNDMDPAPRVRQAKALDDFNSWTMANPKATTEQARKEYHGIVHGYAMVDWGNKTLTMRLPQFLIGTRGEPNLDETTNATNDFYFQKYHGDLAAMSRDPDYIEQGTLIQEWRDALARRNAGTGQTTGSKP